MKKIASMLSFGLVLAIVISGCAKDEEVMTGTISGFVSDYTNANSPIAGATITLNTKGLTKTTGSDGRYEFAGLEPGTYSLSANANEFQPTTKQVTVYAGQIANCDFQLETGKVSVDIDPLNLVFAKDVEQSSFSIKNNSNRKLNYSISNIPDFIQVSPSTGTLAAKGTQAISVSVINRNSITSVKNGQLTVNIGNDSYIVSISVEAYKEETVNVNIDPQSLSFDKDTEQLTFTITSNNSRSLDYSISSNIDILTISPTAGTLEPRAKNTITVYLENRKSIDENQIGQLTINIEGNTFVVSVSVAKYEEGDSQGGEGTTSDVTQGLQAYYNFDNENADDGIGNYHGFLNGGRFVTDTPKGKGKALQLKKKEFVTIGSNMIEKKRNYSISFWVKDFGEGPLFRTSNGGSDTHNFSPTVFVNSKYAINYASKDNSSVEFSALMNSYTSGKWTMITIVTADTNPNQISCPADMTLYINGRKVETIHGYGQSTGTTMQIGGAAYTNFTMDSYLAEGYWADPFMIDNLRIYSKALTSDEVSTIFSTESK